MKKVKVIQVNSEIGAGTRGSSLGSKALEIAAWKEEDDFFRRYPSHIVEDENGLLYDKTDTLHAKNIEGIIKVHERLMNEIGNTLKSGEYFPIVLAGDHSTSAGSVAGVKLAYPDKRLGIIWVDAHGDLHSPYTTPSGNMHGMPLAIALNIDNLQFKTNEPVQKTVSGWNRLKNTGNIAPKALTEDVVFFGVRDIEAAERYLIDHGNMKNFTVEETRERGIPACVDAALQKLSHCDIIYLSFDVDSMDSKLVSMGTGTPVENGFRPDEVEQILHLLVKSGKVVCFDMVEINPTLDNKGNLMAETAFRILRSVTGTIVDVLNKSEMTTGNGN